MSSGVSAKSGTLYNVPTKGGQPIKRTMNIIHCSPKGQRIVLGILTRSYSLKRYCRFAKTCRYFIEEWGCSFVHVEKKRMALPPPKVAEEGVVSIDEDVDYFGPDKENQAS